METRCGRFKRSSNANLTLSVPFFPSLLLPAFDRYSCTQYLVNLVTFAPSVQSIAKEGLEIGEELKSISVTVIMAPSDHAYGYRHLTLTVVTRANHRGKIESTRTSFAKLCAMLRKSQLSLPLRSAQDSAARTTLKKIGNEHGAGYIGAPVYCSLRHD